MLAGALARGTTIIDTTPNWDGNITNGWLAVGQSFTVPTTDTTLSRFTFTLSAPSSVSTVTFKVFNWSATGPTGAALLTQSVAWPANGGDVTLSALNLSLLSGQVYGAVVDLGGYSGASVYYMQTSPYAGGSASWFDGSSWSNYSAAYEMKFVAEFNAVPEPSVVCLVGLGVGVLAVGRLRRRAR
jgi:hypothetical protein